MFSGFPEETVRFFLELRLHNETSFFHAHQEEYQQGVREPFYAFIRELAPVMLGIDPSMETRPDKCLARIHRDTRFSKDKSPYRDHLWLLFRRAGESRENAVMYWFELSPESIEWGLGFWGRNQPAMDALRRRMLTKPSEITSALRQSGIPNKDLQVFGDRYLRMKPPDGMPFELAALYPLKEMYIQRVEPPFHLCFSKELTDIVAKDFLRLKPMYELLRSVADEGMAQLSK